MRILRLFSTFSKYPVDKQAADVIRYALLWVNCRVVLHKLRNNRAGRHSANRSERGKKTRRSTMDYKAVIAALTVASTMVTMADGIVSSSVVG